MKPAPFEYVVPVTIEEALEVLSAHGPDAKILAGGQSLIPLLNLRLARPRVLVDINRTHSLAYLRVDDEGWLHAGALARHVTLERSELVARRLPLLAEAVRRIGHPAIRSRGTAGGSVAHGDPAAEIAGVLTTLGGRVVVRGPTGVRAIRAEDFFIGPLVCDLGATEMVVELQFPPVPAGAGWSFLELSRRHGDFALVGVIALVVLDTEGCIASARLGVIGAGPVPMRLVQAEAVLTGQRPCPSVVQAAAREVQQALDPPSDVHATAEYRREVAGVLVRRALEQAFERARPGASGKGGAR